MRRKIWEDMKKSNNSSELIAVGIPELDHILRGGLTRNRVYLIQGEPGSGKTTLSLQFLMAGVARKEKVLYVTLCETKAELEAVSESHGLSMEGIDVVELVAGETELDPENQYTMFQPAEIQLNVTTKAILDEIERLRPTRVIIDSLSEIKLLAQSALRFRRQVLALKQFFAGRDSTVFFLDDQSSMRDDDLQLESIAHGVISLQQLSPEYGADRRRLRIRKLRGQRYRGGYHDFAIVRGGLTVFPRIVAAEHGQETRSQSMKSGIPSMDALVGGGLDSGTSTLLLGPAGVGKSTLGIQYAVEAAKRGQASLIYAFDERVETMLIRAEGLGIPLRKYAAEGLIDIRPVDPTELSPGEFAHEIRKAVDGTASKLPIKVLLIDSLNGYLNAMPEERFLTAQLHELLTYLGHSKVLTFLVVAQHGLLGQTMKTVVDTSYLADTVILFRYFEAAGEVRQLISVVKKRSGHHERSIREYKMGGDGLFIGEPLTEFRGVLTGTPFYASEDGELSKNNEN